MTDCIEYYNIIHVYNIHDIVTHMQYWFLLSLTHTEC